MNRHVALLALVAAATSACSTERAPPPAPAPVGEYRGHVTLDDSPRPARLSVAQTERGLSAVLALDDGAVAFGQGQWMGGTLYIGFDYGRTSDPPCNGRLLLEATPGVDGLGLSGAVQSRDCTGSAHGAFDFDLFTAAPELPAKSLTPRSGLR